MKKLTQEMGDGLQKRYDEVAKAAQRHNQRHDTAKMQRYQALLGVDPTGSSNDDTARAAFLFQAANDDLVEDGAIGPLTIAKLEARPLPWERMRVGIWWDMDPAYTVRNARKIALRARRDGIDYFQIQLNKSEEKHFRPIWTVAQAEAFTGELAKHGIKAGWMLWAYCSRTWIDGLREKLPALAKALALPEIIEADIEGPWSPSRLDRKMKGEYPNTMAAADDLAVIMHTNAKAIGCGVGSTVFREGVSASNESRRYACRAIGGRCTMQGYSEAFDGEIPINPMSTNGPGRHQFADITRGRELLAPREIEGDEAPDPRVVEEVAGGVNIFDQGRWPSGADWALQLAVLVQVAMGVIHLCQWSGKFWWGGKTNTYSSPLFQWIAALRTAARAAVGGCV